MGANVRRRSGGASQREYVAVGLNCSGWVVANDSDQAAGLAAARDNVVDLGGEHIRMPSTSAAVPAPSLSDGSRPQLWQQYWQHSWNG